MVLEVLRKSRFIANYRNNLRLANQETISTSSGSVSTVFISLTVHV